MATKDITDVQVLLAYRQWHAEGGERWPYDILMQETGQPEKVCIAAMERACDRGLIEYGISLRTGWITQKGEAHLKAARTGANA
jgi:hypothetical protein